ncbi:Synaptotagmin-like mitochondrial-lipid-binding domain containing protein [Trema orientale]|uniref:Synaptotagmin-like mitochondrial-lipid-binding domain containing protein n=1 Tax=Trema orientale TaxID=63057 RepID=A0A2P5EWG0_TREOI|nr:Synaptotagmin-like mitochondrial-lipid-binding domain containing protein [Trema orientale]
MSFFTGLIIGMAIGLGLIIAYARAENARSRRRSDLAKTVATFARMTVKDSKAILPAEFYPPWLNWLNSHLDKLWPYIDEAASELIRSNVEPVLEQYRPVILSSLKFSKLTLGTVAPQFTGVSIVEVEGENVSGGVTMELEMQWDGNPNIVIDVKTRVGVKLPIQVKNIGFTGVFRIIFKPLVDEFPCFGAVSYSLREKKKLDFTLKIVGGDISTIPGISDAIEETIRDAIEDSITWPVRKIVPILLGNYSDLELKPIGTLEVKLVQAKDLTNKDVVGKSDPFAVLFIRPLREKTKTSKTINNQLNPIWNEHFEFIVEDASTQHLTIRVFDDEGVQASELIGCAQVPLKDLEPGKVKDVWLKLVKDLEVQRDTKYRGQVQLELLYCPFGTESNIKNPFNPDYALTTLEKALKSGNDGTEASGIGKTATHKKREVIVRGVLSVTVISAEDLPIVDLLGKADPYVVLIMKKSETKAKTRVLNENLNPIWNQTFDFVVEDALHEMLILEVWDHDTFGKDKIGRVIMTLTRALLEGEFQDSFPLEGAKSGRLNLHFKWTPQPIFRDT